MTTIEGRWSVQGPLDLQRTFRLGALWGANPWLHFDDSGVWFARHTRSGPATVHLTADDTLHGEAWGPGAAELLDTVPQLVGLATPSFSELDTPHRAVRELARRWPGYRQVRTGALYGRLVATALAQKVTGKNGKMAVYRMVRRWGRQAPGPLDRLYLLPPPAELARIPYYDFHPLGVERHRADLVKRIASRIRALERCLNMPHADGRAHLEKLRGIGPWTSGVVASWALGDPDAVPWGDYHLPNYVAYNLAGEERADDARMEELLAPYAGVRGMVVRAVKAGGRTPPRYGPKSAVRDIRRL